MTSTLSGSGNANFNTNPANSLRGSMTASQLGSSVAKGQGQSLLQQQQQQQQPKSLQELLQQSRQLHGVIQAHGQLQPSATAIAGWAPANAPAVLHRSLDQVAHRSLLLVERCLNDQAASSVSASAAAAAAVTARTAGAAPQSVDATAQSFLASAGVNAQQLKRDLDSLDVTKTLDPVRPVASTDYVAFLNNEHDNLIVSTLELAKQKTAWDLDCLVAQANNADWEFSKRAFFASLSLSPAAAPTAPSATAASPGAPTSPGSLYTSGTPGDRFRSTLGGTASPVPTPSSPSSHAATSARSAAYLRALAHSNESGFNSNLFADFRLAAMGPTSSASASTPNSPFSTASFNSHPDTHQLAPLWDLLHALLSSASPLDHAHHYLVSPAPPTSFSLGLLSRSRRYLESTFFDFIEETVQRNPAIARAGGDPSPLNRVAAFARARHLKAGLKWDIPHVELAGTPQGDVPLWAVVYYLVRAGRPADAVEFLKLHQDAVLSTDTHFYMYLAAWAQGGVEDGSALQRDLREYNAQLVMQQQAAAEAAVGMSTAERYGFGYHLDHLDGGAGSAIAGVDPFKLAVLKLVGRCDVNNKKMDRVVSATEDWLWVRLVLVGEREYIPHDLQTEVLALEAHFAQQHPARYATVLATAGLFDHAVVHLLKAGSLIQDALHVALALMQVGCLRVPADPTDVLGMQVDVTSPAAQQGHVKTVPIHTLVAQYLSSPAMANATSLEKLQYLVRLPLYAVGTDGNASSTSSARAAWQQRYAQWRDYTLDQLVPWAMEYPSAQALAVHPRLLAMLGLADMPAFHSLVTKRAAEVARAQDKLDVAVYLSAQALDPRSVFETLHAMLARAIVHGPSMLALGAAAGVTSAAPALGASVGGSAASRPLQDVVNAADFVLAHFGGARSLNDFASDATELRQLEGMRDVALLLRDVLNVKAVATEVVLVGAASQMMGARQAMPGTASPMDALNTLHALHLIPSGAADLATCIERVRQLPVVAHGVVPVVLKLAMDLVVRVCREEASAAAAFGGSMQQQLGMGQAEVCRQMAGAIRQFAGVVPFNMDASVHAYLASKVTELARY